LKSVHLSGPRDICVTQVPEPNISDDSEVKIRTEYCAICADDARIYKGAIPAKYLDSGMGHEFSGTIVEVGREAARFGKAVGDRVSGFMWDSCGRCPYCMRGQENLCINRAKTKGCMAEYIVLKDKNVIKVSDQVTLRDACLTEIVSACMHGNDLADIQSGNSVMIFGAGGAGLLHLQLALMRGATKTTVVEPIKSKRQLAMRLGAQHVINPQDEDLIALASSITDDLNFDVVIEASGNPAVLPNATSLLAKKGTLLLFSLYPPDIEISLNMTEMYLKEIKIVSSFMAPNLLPRAMNIIPRLNLNALIEKEFPLDDAKKAFEAQELGIYPRVVIKMH